MAKEKPVEESVGVGWIFWTIAFGVLVGPFLYFFWDKSYDDVTTLFPVTIAVCAAAVVAGFVSVGVNSVLHRRHERRRKAERKKDKKKRK